MLLQASRLRVVTVNRPSSRFLRLRQSASVPGIGGGQSERPSLTLRDIPWGEHQPVNGRLPGSGD